MPMQEEQGGESIAPTHSPPRCWKVVGIQHNFPAALPQGKTRYLLYSRLRGPRDRDSILGPSGP
jgi:hypothetical protein